MLIEVSPGELVDKLTILKIKLHRITDAAKLANVKHEYDTLMARFTDITTGSHPDIVVKIHMLWDKLLQVNSIIWDIEDVVRDCERIRSFDERFITAARGVYLNNDQRAALKREINVLLESQIVEEKSYAKYQ